jgi:hypothetical protein
VRAAASITTFFQAKPKAATRFGEGKPRDENGI